MRKSEEINPSTEIMKKFTEIMFGLRVTGNTDLSHKIKRQNFMFQFLSLQNENKMKDRNTRKRLLHHFTMTFQYNEHKYNTGNHFLFFFFFFLLSSCRYPYYFISCLHSIHFIAINRTFIQTNNKQRIFFLSFTFQSNK